MNPALYIIFFILIVFLLTRKKSEQTAAVRRIQKKRRLKGAAKMHEFLEQYIGKECLVYTINSQLQGTVSKLQDGWLCLTDNDGSVETLNLDYVIRIREFPRKKNGKKKSVVLD